MHGLNLIARSGLTRQQSQAEFDQAQRAKQGYIRTIERTARSTAAVIGNRSSPHIALVSEMIALGRCGWTPL